MEFSISFIELGVLFLIIEIFFLTWDFLILGIFSIIVWWFLYFFDFSFLNEKIFKLVFVILLLLIFLVKRYTLGVRKQNKNDLIWEKLIVKEINWQTFVYHNWEYRSITFDENYDISPWDTVEILENSYGYLKVKKLF